MVLTQQVRLCVRRLIEITVMVGFIFVRIVLTSAVLYHRQMPGNLETDARDYLWATTTNALTAQWVSSRYGLLASLQCPNAEPLLFRIHVARPVIKDVWLCCSLVVKHDRNDLICQPLEATD